MTLSTAINGSANGGGASARTAKVTNGSTGVVARIPTGLKAPLTVSRDSGSTSITFAASGNQLTASIASALAAGSSLSAIARVTQADGAGVLIPVTLTGIAAAPTVPAAPTVTLTAGDGQISIAWSDNSNGGAAITAHRIYVNGTGMSPNSGASPYVLTGLANGAAVSIEVSAINSVGEGPKSAVQSATPVAGATLPTFALATETTTATTAMTTAGATPNSRRQYTLDRMVKRLKTAGIWTKLTGLWVVGDTAAVSAINVRNPGTNNLVANGAPTFTAPGTNVIPGWTFPTISDFLDTGIAANTISQNDHSFGYVTREQASTVTSFDMGAQATGAALYIKKAATNRAMVSASTGANQSPTINTASWDGLGLYAISRTDSAGYQAYHGGIEVGRVTDASVAQTAVTTMTVGKVNGQTTTCKATVNAAFIGQGLTTAEMAQLHAILLTYLDAVEYGDLAINEAGYAPAAPAKFDVVVYGATLAGCIAAYRLASLGRSVAIVGGWRDRNLGGMTGNGLALVDYDSTGAIGGLAWDVCAAARAVDSLSTAHTADVGVLNLSAQPKNFRSILRRMLDGARTNGYSVPIYWSDGVASAAKTGTRVTSLTTVDGRTFTADYFLDTTEELDLAYVSGCTTTIGRERAPTTTWERLNGYRGTDTSTGSNDAQLEGATAGVRLPIDNAYVTVGNPGSGLIYGIEPMPTGLAVGDADSSVMAYTFRQTWNNNQARRVPFGTTPPDGYDPAKYELLGRYLAFYPGATLATIMKPSGLPGGTATDTNNNGAISFNLVNSGRDYAACEAQPTRAQVYAARELVFKNVESWVRGYIHYVLNSGDSRIPSGIVTSLAGYGWDWRNHLDPHPNDQLYWPQRLYVRELRRLVGDYVINGVDVTKADGTTPRSTKTISTICYRFDNHIHRRFPDTASSTIFCEGGIGLSQAASGGQANGADEVTPVPYEAYLPKVADCTNLAVTFGLSASHVAMSAARMELTSAQAGESLAYAIHQAIGASKQNLQDVDYPTLRTAILASTTTYPANLPQVN